MSHTPLRYSQNFLHNPYLVQRLLARSSLTSDDVVYEIGPGKGILTDGLSRRCRRVVAVELDCALAERLQRRYGLQSNVTVQMGDFLERSLPTEAYKVFANIPFARTHDIVTKLTSAAYPPDDAYLIMQREAAEKFCGLPREYLYAVLLKPWFTVDIVYHFRRSDFTPAPNVEVVMLRLQKRGPPLIAPSERQLFRDFIVYGFVTPLPTLERTLQPLAPHRRQRDIMSALAIEPDATPSTVTFSQWLQLYQRIVLAGSDHTRALVRGSERRLRQQQARLRKSHRTRLPYRSKR